MSLSAPEPGAPSAMLFSSSSVVGSVTLLAALDAAADSSSIPPGAALATGSANGSLGVVNGSSVPIKIAAILSWSYLLELERFAPAGDLAPL